VSAPSAGLPEGRVVDFDVGATDNADPAPRIVCNCESGKRYPLGTTEVNCTATDAAGNSASGGFTITVLLGAATFEGFIQYVHLEPLDHEIMALLVQRIEAAAAAHSRRRDPPAGEPAADGPDRQRGVDRAVEKDEIELLDGEIGQQAVGGVLAADEPDLRVARLRWSQEARGRGLGTASAMPT